MTIGQIEIISNSASQTEKIGEELAIEALKERRKKSLIIGLKGDLGGGKTTFMKGFARGLGIRDKILSPTFVIFRKYNIKNSFFDKFYHFDCYRIESGRDILELRLREIFSDSKSIIAIEWSERLSDILPEDILTVDFEVIGEKKRKITVKENSRLK